MGRAAGLSAILRLHSEEPAMAVMQDPTSPSRTSVPLPSLAWRTARDTCAAGAPP